MDYEFITTITTILLVGASIIGVTLTAIKTQSRTTDVRFARIDERLDRMDARFDRMDARLDGMDTRFEKIDERFFAMQKSLDERLLEMQKSIDERLLEMQKSFGQRSLEIQNSFTVVNASIARLEGMMEGIRHATAQAIAPEA